MGLRISDITRQLVYKITFFFINYARGLWRVLQIYAQFMCNVIILPAVCGIGRSAALLIEITSKNTRSSFLPE